MTRLIVLQKTASAKQVNLQRTPFVIGRADNCDLVLDNPLVSRSHAVIEINGNSVTIRDLQSHNGTYVNGVKVERAWLKNGDEIRLGGSQIRFLAQAGVIADAEALRLVSVPGRLDELDLQKLDRK